MMHTPQTITYNFSATRRMHYQWSPLQQANRKEIPLNIQSWLSETGSITTRLKKLGALTVEVLFDRWDKATPKERKKLKLDTHTRVRVREVILRLNGTPVIYARSIIPATVLKGQWRRLTNIGDRPLGNFLFKNGHMCRGNIEITKLPAESFPHLEEAVWARRSVFSRYGHGVLVNEAFFPTITLF
ncbi:chorismate lyase [Marinomonas agarivorans]|nr:chorismate lyase [Marinomonas agarivorans]